MKSWRTTLSGIVLALGILLTQAGHLLDDDPNTTADTTAMAGAAIAIAGAVGVGFNSRDKKVTSEAEGAK